MKIISGKFRAFWFQSFQVLHSLTFSLQPQILRI